MFVLAFSLLSDSSGHAVNRCPDAVSESQSQMLLAFPQGVQVALPEADRNHFDGTFHKILHPLDIHEQPFCSDVVTRKEVAGKLTDSHSKVPATVPANPVVAKAFPPVLDWLFDPNKKRLDRDVELQADPRVFDRILARLVQQETHETDAWLKQDYRQAWICVSLASKGNVEPFTVSSYQIYGKHPEKVWPAIMHNRRMKLAKEFGQWFSTDGQLLPDTSSIPKKPAINESAERAVNERIAALVPFPKKERA